MPESWKWGFTPGERSALLLICAAVLLGLGYQAYQRQHSPQTVLLSSDDSLRIAAITAIANITDSLAASPPADSLASGLLDINTATCNQWESLPGIGPALAGRIVAARDSLGGFKKPEDLLTVPGIGPKRLDRIRPLLLLSDGNSGN
jgi:competence ComEA-like helix-hairpin-helix protein